MEQLVEKRWNVSVTGPPPVYPPVPPSAQCGNEEKNARQGRGGGVARVRRRKRWLRRSCDGFMRHTTSDSLRFCAGTCGAIMRPEDVLL